jgi:hypothetical protein
MSKLGVVASWLFLVPATIFASIFILGQVSKTKEIRVAASQTIKVLAQTPPYEIFSAIPTQFGGLSSSIVKGDARTFILQNALAGSPLFSYSQLLVETADKYNLDFRLMPAIAIVESGGGRAMIYGSHNAWGFENGATKFSSWEEAIEKVAQTLKSAYIDQGLVTPEQMMPKYAPPSVAKGGPWAKKVNLLFEQMK